MRGQGEEEGYQVWFKNIGWWNEASCVVTKSVLQTASEPEQDK